MPDRWESLSVLQFWLFSAISVLSEVEMSEFYSSLVSISLIKFPARALNLVVVAIMPPFFGQGSVIYDPTVTIGQSGFVEIWSNSVRFSTFLSTDGEFSHAIFTVTRCFYYKNRK